MKIKVLIKTIYTYFFNWNKICRFKSFGKNSFLGRRCTINISGNGIRIGNNVRIGDDARLSCYRADNHTAEIIIHDGAYIGTHFSILTAEKVEIENNVLIASHVTIIGQNHGMNPEDNLYYKHQPLTASPVIIKEGTWIGENVSILPGVSVGKKCIIGTSSVVTKSIPDYCIAVGNPARIIKKYNFNTHNWENFK